MPRASAVSLVLFLIPFALAKDKDKILFPADVLNAQTAIVIIHPDAGEPVTDPAANRTAQQNVETALMQWRRFRLVMEAQSADLIFVVRKGTGRTVGPTIKGGPIDDRPVILQSPGTGDIRIGGGIGRPPDSQRGRPQDSRPSAGQEVGPSEDMLEVYRGGVGYSLDSPPVWRIMAKNALKAPAVPAIEEFRKAIDEAEKAVAKQKAKKRP